MLRARRLIGGFRVVGVFDAELESTESAYVFVGAQCCTTVSWDGEKMFPKLRFYYEIETNSKSRLRSWGLLRQSTIFNRG